MILYNVHTNQHQEYTLKKYCDEFSNNSLNDGFNVKDDEAIYGDDWLLFETKDEFVKFLRECNDTSELVMQEGMQEGIHAYNNLVSQEALCK